MLVLKIGSLDDHSWFQPEAVIYCCDKQEFHVIPEGIKVLDKA